MNGGGVSAFGAGESGISACAGGEMGGAVAKRNGSLADVIAEMWSCGCDGGSVAAMVSWLG